MKASVCAVPVGLLCLLALSVAKQASPKVQVYSRYPEELEKGNTIICHVSGFHPPEITIDLLKNGKEIQGATQTDLAFEENWHYHLTKYAPFHPVKGQRYSCKVTHQGQTNEYHFESDF